MKSNLNKSLSVIAIFKPFQKKTNLNKLFSFTSSTHKKPTLESWKDHAFSTPSEDTENKITWESPEPSICLALAKALTLTNQ